MTLTDIATLADIAEITCDEIGAGGSVGSGGLRLSRAPDCEPPPRGAGSIAPVAPVAECVALHRDQVAPAELVDVELRRFAISATTVVLEVMGGRRPFAHLGEVTLPHIVDQFRVLLASGHTRGQGCKLLRLHTQHTRPDVAEITVVYSRGERVHALGARVERRTVLGRAAAPGGPRRRERRCVLVAVNVG